ncbi:hypothetical protein APHAL10511_006666 [Amanita phalloides]|nr:hypothetical protein APHAL10511_006666 [Amanita phalloides]
MATTQRRRANTQPAPKPIKRQTKTTSADKLADALAAQLTISDGANNRKRKQKAPGNNEPVSDEEKRIASMRAVNAASQALSVLFQSGWRRSETAPAKKTALSNAVEASESASKHLAILRSLHPRDLNVERAAMSILSKLVALEMDDAAFNTLKDIHPRLCAHLNVSSLSNQAQSPTSYICIPANTNNTDSTLLTVVSTYLTYALTINVQLYLNCLNTKGKLKDDKPIHTLANALNAIHDTLLSWIPNFTSLPSKHIDALLMRAYAVLTNFCTTYLAASPPPPPLQRSTSRRPVTIDNPHNASIQQNIYRIRMYALQCLAHTSDSVAMPTSIWEQAVRFGSAYVKSLAPPRAGQKDNSAIENEATQTILDACSKLADHMQLMPDWEKFAKDKMFVSFLEWWMTFARRACDLQILNRISSLMRPVLVSSASSSSDCGSSSRVDETNEVPESSLKDKNSKTTEALLTRSVHICTVLAQITALIELMNEGKGGHEFIDKTHEALPLISNSKSLQELLLACYSTPNSDDKSFEELRRAGDKCDRSLEKLRITALKCLENIPVSDYSLQDTRTTLVQMSEGVADLFNRALQAHPCNSFITRALDTLFSLARTTLVAHDPRTHDSALKFLEKSLELLRLDQKKPSSGLNLPNYVRCVAGMFHNMAGTLYQADKHGAAIAFLVDACKLGQRALSMHLVDRGKAGRSNCGGRDESAANEQREADGWKQLEEQLYRRWELLGVCYSKMGDRRNAYAAFAECVKAFPYSSSGFVDRARRLSSAALFEATPALKQLANIVDRVSYMAGCELLFDSAEVSLARESAWGDVERPESVVLGALLERQISGLETSRWKPNVRLIVAHLLRNANEIYQADVYPVRRARVLLRWLEYAYYGGMDGESPGDDFGTVAEVTEEIECLLSRESLVEDVELAPFRAQYKASAHLWRALHAHRTLDADQNTLIAQHAEHASSILKILLNDSARSGPRKSTTRVSLTSPPKRIPPSKRVGVAAKRVAATNTAAAAPRTRAAKKAVVKEPVTPKPKTRAVLQAIPLNSATPPRTAVANPNANKLALDDFDRFLNLLQTTSHILGLMALILPKVHILDVTRKICERCVGVTSDGYISASIDLAHEYVKLGKLRRASAVFNHALNSVRSGQVSDDVCSLFLLRYAEALAVLEDVPQSSTVYCEALASSQKCLLEEKSMPTLQKIQLRVKRLERTAMAAHVFALIQHSRNNTVVALDGMLQSLRLWNRAVDTLSRLSPNPSSKIQDSEKDVFEATSLKEALPNVEPVQPQQQEKRTHRLSLNSLEWRVSEGLLSVLFSLCQAYLFRGSAKEAEYFAQQAHDLSQSINAPALLSRALAKKGEILLQLGKLEEAHECLANASNILSNIRGIDSADVYRLRGDHSQRASKHEDAQQMYVETTTMLEELDTAFRQFDGLALGPRKSAGLAPMDKPAKETIVPDLLATVLRQQIWLLRDEGGDEYMALLEKLMGLPYSTRTKAEENALMAQLTLHNVYSRFRNDMFLSSLAESAIALPMGMTNKQGHAISPTTQDLLNILENAAKLFWSNLSLITTNGCVPDIRNATISLALISAFQTSLGRPGKGGSSLAVGLLDASSAITLHREMLEAIQHKFFDLRSIDDLEWPRITPEGKPLPRPVKQARSIFDASDEDDEDLAEKNLKSYWDHVRQKYQSRLYDPESLSSCSAEQLPANWTVVHISVTGDKNILFISRQRGNTESSPLIFCVPLKGRRDNGAADEDENHLMLEDALGELREIVRLSDLGTRAAVHINPEDELARMNWWKERRDLDRRLKELLGNIEFCWLGAFKTILNPNPNYPPELRSEFRLKLEKVFRQCLGVREKQIKSRNQKNANSAPSVIPSELRLDEALVECFSTLSPKCRDEELEDMIYFILDLYQFHGVRVAIAEIDTTQLMVDLRTALEEHVGRVRKFEQENASARQAKPSGTTPSAGNEDEHIFLVLGKDVQGIPWESIPVLRGRSVSRVPSLNFLLDRVEFVRRQRANSTSPRLDNFQSYGAPVDPRKGYYVLNPSGDLGRTQERFINWVKDMEKVGWRGTVGRPPSEQEFLEALQRQDLVVYFGHGGGEQYVRTHKIRHLSQCAATMLWGCSSGALREMGDFDRTGTPNSYFVAGCPTLIANLWDVTDKDIDKFSQSVFDKLKLMANYLTKVRQDETNQDITRMSVVAAVAQSRDVCKLKYLTGAAPVVYGIPFYL